MKQANGAVNNCVKKEMTVFGQLQKELRGWSGSALRRSYIARGHGGQPRAFKVKLIGEGVNDYSGPYREVSIKNYIFIFEIVKILTFY